MATAVHVGPFQNVSNSSQAAESLIHSLNERVNELSATVFELRKQKISLQETHDQELFRERQACEQLALQIQSLNAEAQQRNLHIAAMEQQLLSQTRLI